MATLPEIEMLEVPGHTMVTRREYEAYWARKNAEWAEYHRKNRREEFWVFVMIFSPMVLFAVYVVFIFATR
jgi:hypothetical protein